jgi:hypothetical protein
MDTEYNFYAKRTLWKSVEHWLSNFHKVNSDDWNGSLTVGVNSCDLCKEYFDFGYCTNCPVYLTTKSILCHATPVNNIKLSIKLYNEIDKETSCKKSFKDFILREIIKQYQFLVDLAIEY